MMDVVQVFRREKSALAH